MTESQRFKSVWDALEDSPEQAENMKLRAELMHAIRDHVASLGLTQQQAAARLGLTQPRLSDLMRGRIDRFSLDKLVSIVARTGKHVRIQLSDEAA